MNFPVSRVSSIGTPGDGFKENIGLDSLTAISVATALTLYIIGVVLVRTNDGTYFWCVLVNRKANNVFEFFAFARFLAD